MGRAHRGSQAVATADKFALFGRRGRPENDTVAARNPTALARAEADLLLEDAGAFDPQKALAALATHVTIAAERPLLVEIADAVGERPISDARRMREGWLRELLNATGLRSEYAQTLVICRHTVIHIWPDGEQWQGGLGLPNAFAGAKTVCGQTVDGHRRSRNYHDSGFTRCRRGDWQMGIKNIGRFRVCQHCARVADEYPECAEDREYQPFGTAQTEFNDSLRSAFRDRLFACLRVTPRIERATLWALANDAYRERATTALLDRIVGDPERTFKRAAEGTPILTHTGEWVVEDGEERPPVELDRAAWLRVLTPALDRAFDATHSAAGSLEHTTLRKLIATELGFPPSRY